MARRKRKQEDDEEGEETPKEPPPPALRFNAREYAHAPEGRYVVESWCHNCHAYWVRDESGLLSFELGKLVSAHSCPFCGCTALHSR